MKQAHINLLKSAGFLILAVFMFSVVTYAWFTITYTNDASLVGQISGVEAEYEFYVYKNQYHTGSNEQTLIDNTCAIGDEEDLCYEKVNNPIEPKLIDGSVAPGERFSFAVSVESMGSTQGYLDLSLGQVISVGYDRVENKIQTAFGYEVTKISYISNSVETNDMKAQMIYQPYTMLSYEDNVIYPLVTDIPLVYNNDYQGTLVIYFDLYYDPTVFGIDENDLPYTNSHIFMNQTLHINDIYMNVSLQEEHS